MKTRAQKKDDIAFLSDKMKNTGGVVVAQYAGLTVKAITDLRNRVRAEGGETKVMKNTLAKLAVKDSEFSGITDYLSGQTLQFMRMIQRFLHVLPTTFQKIMKIW